MKSITLLFILLFTLFACKKADPVKTFEPGIIENQTFQITVLIDGHEHDGTIIRNCIFENIDGDALQIRNVDNLIIENCIFRNISEDAIRFRVASSSNGVQILNNTIYNVEENGILAPENHINTLIKGNTIYNVATNNASSIAGAPHHGIYFQGYNVSIVENTIYDIINTNGNCVSIRTYGEVSRNILHNAADHGISYYSDHPGDNKELLIENNFIYDNGQRAIQLASNGTASNHIGSAKIRFNTLISSDQSDIGINDLLSGVAIDLVGNILIRTDGGSTYIYTTQPYTDLYNLTATGDIGFEDYSIRNLHLLPTSSAVSVASGTTQHPATDIDGDARNSTNLDCGADEL